VTSGAWQTPSPHWISFASKKIISAEFAALTTKTTKTYPTARIWLHHARMMNEKDAHSGANPETEDIEPIDAIIAEEIDDDDDNPGFEVIYDSTPGGPDAPKPEEAGPPDPVAIAPPNSVEPVGTVAILEAQLGEALKLMRDFPLRIRNPTSDVGDRVYVAGAVSGLVTASATLAKVAAQLQHGAPETRHRIIVERDFASAGGGAAPSRKRINHGGA
jgi:hypothetical protein